MARRKEYHGYCHDLVMLYHDMRLSLNLPTTGLVNYTKSDYELLYHNFATLEERQANIQPFRRRRPDFPASTAAVLPPFRKDRVIGTRYDAENFNTAVHAYVRALPAEFKYAIFEHGAVIWVEAKRPAIPCVLVLVGVAAHVMAPISADAPIFRMAYMDGFGTATHTIRDGRYVTAEEAWATERFYGDMYQGFGDEVQGQLRDMFFRGYADGVESRTHPKKFETPAYYDAQVLAYEMQQPHQWMPRPASLPPLPPEIEIRTYTHTPPPLLDE